MTYKCVHKDSQVGFSVYRGDSRDDLLLVAALPGADQREIAMRLIDPEHILFVHYTDCFPDLVGDFVASWEAPRFKARLISIQHRAAGIIECPE
jgi:hypothetical protein